jgi:hypothetical protein
MENGGACVRGIDEIMVSVIKCSVGEWPPGTIARALCCDAHKEIPLSILITRQL